jgi:hypothetical protein
MRTDGWMQILNMNEYMLQAQPTLAAAKLKAFCATKARAFAQTRERCFISLFFFALLLSIDVLSICARSLCI